MQGELIDWVNCHPVDKIARVYALLMVRRKGLLHFSMNVPKFTPLWPYFVYWREYTDPRFGLRYILAILSSDFDFGERIFPYPIAIP